VIAAASSYSFPLGFRERCVVPTREFGYPGSCKANFWTFVAAPIPRLTVSTRVPKFDFWEHAGMLTAVIERNLFGGTCVNIGCMPTKALVASAYAVHLA
jgi:hypothetical protein